MGIVAKQADAHLPLADIDRGALARLIDKLRQQRLNHIGRAEGGLVDIAELHKLRTEPPAAILVADEQTEFCERPRDSQDRGFVQFDSTRKFTERQREIATR